MDSFFFVWTILAIATTIICGIVFTKSHNQFVHYKNCGTSDNYDCDNFLCHRKIVPML